MFDKAFVIANGTTLFYQWDRGQKIIVGVDCQEVHCTNDGVKSLPSEVYEENGQKVARIDDIFFQEAKPLTVYGYVMGDDGEYTLAQHTFQVRGKPKPITYAYTPTETKTWDDLKKRIDELFEGDEISKAVSDYLEKNPVEAGATAEQAQQINKNKTDIEALATNKLDASKLPEAVNTALFQAKESGLFDGKPGSDGRDGEDGYTPVKGVDYFDGKDGQDGRNGIDGADGQPGKDGTSPVVSVATITGGHRITITDKNSTKTVDVMHGKNGTDGKPGADGSPGKDGSNGQDGYTPVKGKDYFTDAEKTEMVNAVKAALPIYAGEVAAV